MERLAILGCAVAPAMALLGYGIAKTRSRWTSEATWQAFFAGAVSALAAVVVEYALERLLGLGHMAPVRAAAIEALLVASVPEEALKFVVLVAIAERHVDVRRRQDILLLSLAVGLGFAALENLAYIAAPGDWQRVALTRAATAVPSHGIDGLAMGAFVTLARLRGDQARRWLAAALAVPILLHAVYDFPLLLVHKSERLAGVLPAWIVWCIGTAIAVVYVCNKVLAAAAVADRASGRDRESAGASLHPLLGGAAIIASAPLAAMALFLVGSDLWKGAALGLLPIVLGVDLMRTGWRRKRAADIALQQVPG